MDQATWVFFCQWVLSSSEWTSPSFPVPMLLSCPVRCPGLAEDRALEPTDIPISGRSTAPWAGERSRRSTRSEVTLGLLCLAHVVLGRNMNQSQTCENQILHKNLDFSLLLKIISSGDVGPAFPSGDNLRKLSDG